MGNFIAFFRFYQRYVLFAQPSGEHAIQRVWLWRDFIFNRYVRHHLVHSTAFVDYGDALAIKKDLDNMTALTRSDLGTHERYHEKRQEFIEISQVVVKHALERAEFEAKDIENFASKTFKDTV